MRRLFAEELEKEEAKKIIDECTRVINDMRRRLLKLKSCWNYAEVMLDNLCAALCRARTRYALEDVDASDLLLSTA